MDANHQEGYPAIAKARRMSAARLGSVRSARTEQTQRSLAPPAAAGQDQERAFERQQEGTWIWRRGETLTAAVKAAAAVAVAAAESMQTTIGDGDPTDFSEANAPSLGRRKAHHVECAPPAAPSALSCRQRSPTRGHRETPRSEPSSVSTSRSVSPLPPRQPERARGKGEPGISVESTLTGLRKILSGVRGEAVDLDRFLSLEVEPAAQQIFDAAVVEHTEAFRLLEWVPAATLASDGDAGTHASNQKQRRGGVSKDGGRPVATSSSSNHGSDAATAAATAADSSASTAAAVAAAAAAAVAAVLPGATTTASASASSNEPGAVAASADPTDAWRRAVRARVIQVGPSPSSSVRSSLPVRGRHGAVTAGLVGRRPPIVEFVGGSGGGGGGGGGSGSARWSLPGRQHHINEDSGKAGKNESQEEEEEEEGQQREVGKSSGSRGDGVVAAGRGGRSRVAGGVRKALTSDGRRGGVVDGSGGGDSGCGGASSARSSDLDEEDEDGWSVPLPARQLATTISAKIVGLSAEIRRRAAAEPGKEGRRKQ